MSAYTDKSLVKLFDKYMVEKSPDTAHAKLSASGSERWLGCPGSIRQSKGLPTINNEHSIAGTHAHTLLQFILENKMWSSLLTAKEAKRFKNFIGYSEDQLASVMVAVDYVRAEQLRVEKESGTPPQLYIEKKVELEGVGFGTADIILHQPFGVLHIMDYKNGVSPVEAVENTQGLYYAHAAADFVGWDFSEVWVSIIQPNANHRGGPIRTWKTTPERVEQAGKMFRLGAKATRKPDAPLVPNAKYCYFCQARQFCPEQIKAKTIKIMERFKR